MTDKLLTIAIPTYNRSAYLDTCLLHITQQLCSYESIVEIIVSDNCSSDNTEVVVTNYINIGFDIKYICNSENIGADRNFTQCFTLANGKYVLVLGDDDILLDGALSKIIPVLQTGEFGIVYLNSYGFKNDYIGEKPKNNKSESIQHLSAEDFLLKVNYYITFSSANICNKSLLPENFDFGKYISTNLVQVYWYLTALTSNAGSNVLLNDFYLAAKVDNSGGYNFCKVFGTNFNTILSDCLQESKFYPIIRHINNRMLYSFFPGLILGSRIHATGHKFSNINFFDDLYPLYKRYISFWICIVPLIKLPPPLAKIYFVVVRIFNKIIKIYYNDYQ